MGVNLLLDTHVLVWLAADSPRAGVATRTLLADAAERHVSAASAYEIATRTRSGRLVGGHAVLDGWDRLLRNLQAAELPMTSAHMRRGPAPWPGSTATRSTGCSWPRPSWKASPG